MKRFCRSGDKLVFRRVQQPRERRLRRIHNESWFQPPEISFSLAADNIAVYKYKL